MKFFLLLSSAFLICNIAYGAKTRLPITALSKNTEIQFLDLKLKKEVNDKKLSPSKKYMLSILAARELKQLNAFDKALEFYSIAHEIKIDDNKSEVNQALGKQPPSTSIYFSKVNLKSLIASKSYEKAILSLNPDKLSDPDNRPFKIIYDLLNVKIKKRAVKKLYCFDDYQKNPDDYHYSNLLCDLMIDYLQDGKLGNDHIKNVEEYFFKHDLKEIYLLQIVKDLKSSL